MQDPKRSVQPIKSTLALALLLVAGIATFLRLNKGGESDIPPMTGQSGTPTPLPAGTREIQWWVDEGSYTYRSSTPPAGYTPPPFSYIYTEEQAIAAAMGIIGRTQYTTATAKRTTRKQIAALFASAIPAVFGIPTPTMPSVEHDFSDVQWAVVLQLPEAYSASEGTTAMGLPVFVPAPGANSSDPDLSLYGKIVVVAFDELGNRRMVQLLDPTGADGLPGEVIPMDAINTLGDVGPSITATP